MQATDQARFKNFKAALKYFQDLSSLTINNIVSAAGIKLASFKEKNAFYFIGQLTPEEISELSTLNRTLKSIVAKYERDKSLNPSNIKKMTKINRLTKIQERDIEMETVIEKSSVAILHRILKLSSERISPVTKSAIKKAVEKYIGDFNFSDVRAEDARVELLISLLKLLNQ
jgi:hypothetical protein